MTNKFVWLDLTSKPAPGAIERDWTGVDFTVSMSLWDGKKEDHILYRTFQVTDAEKNTKPKGKKAKLGKDGLILFVIPICRGDQNVSNKRRT